MVLPSIPGGQSNKLGIAVSRASMSESKAMYVVAVEYWTWLPCITSLLQCIMQCCMLMCTCSEISNNWLVVKIRMSVFTSLIRSNRTLDTTTGNESGIPEQLCRLLNSCLSFRQITSGLWTTLSESSCSSKQMELTRRRKFLSYSLLLGERRMPCLETSWHNRSWVKRV